MPLRIQYPDALYHVMNRGRRGVLNEPRNVAIFLIRRLLKEALQKYEMQDKE